MRPFYRESVRPMRPFYRESVKANRPFYQDIKSSVRPFYQIRSVRPNRPFYPHPISNSLTICNFCVTFSSNADVVVSTAYHEFFGVAVVEAAICGCYPLVPQRLVYPEIFGNSKDSFCYRTDQQMFKILRDFCNKPYLARTKWTKQMALNLYEQYSSIAGLKNTYMKLFESTE